MIRVGTPSVSLMWVMRSKRAAQCFSLRLDGRSLAADVKAEAGEADSGGQYVLDDEFRVSGINAELRRQIRLRRRVTEREPHENVDVVGQARELLGLDRIVDDEGADTRDVGVVDVGELLDRVGVDAPVDGKAKRANEIDFGPASPRRSRNRWRRPRAAQPGGATSSPRSADRSRGGATSAAGTARPHGRDRAPAAACRAAR